VVAATPLQAPELMQTNPTGERLPSPHPIKACWVSFDERRWVSFDERQGPVR
jgi:hypothetical protein